MQQQPVSFLAPTVHYARLPQDQGGILLDLFAGDYIALPPLSAQLWEWLMEGLAPDEMDRRLSAQMPPDERKAYLSAFMHVIAQRAWYSNRPLGQIPQRTSLLFFLLQKVPWLVPHQRWIWLEVCFMLWMVERGTSAPGGLHRLLEQIQRLPASRSVSPGDQQITLYSRSLRALARLLPFRASCFHQSLVFCWLLRRRGIDAQVVIGVYTGPFCAHAWVECAGQILRWQADTGSYADAHTTRNALTVVFRTSGT